MMSKDELVMSIINMYISDEYHMIGKRYSTMMYMHMSVIMMTEVLYCSMMSSVVMINSDYYEVMNDNTSDVCVSQ